MTPAASAPPPGARTVLLAGASGLVGRELARLLHARGDTVHALVRRFGALPRGTPAHEVVVDYAGLPVLPPAMTALCALGTTINVAGSQAAFRAVDFDAVLAFARAAKAAGVTRFGAVSALGADATSSNFYSRVKGETEAALARLGFAVLVLARPSLLAGDRGALGQPVRRGERLGLALAGALGPLIPRSVRPIGAAVVARGLLAALDEARPGVRVLSSAELQRLGTAP